MRNQDRALKHLYPQPPASRKCFCKAGAERYVSFRRFPRHGTMSLFTIFAQKERFWSALFVAEGKPPGFGLKVWPASHAISEFPIGKPRSSAPQPARSPILRRTAPATSP